MGKSFDDRFSGIRPGPMEMKFRVFFSSFKRKFFILSCCLGDVVFFKQRLLASSYSFPHHQHRIVNENNAEWMTPLRKQRRKISVEV